MSTESYTLTQSDLQTLKNLGITAAENITKLDDLDTKSLVEVYNRFATRKVTKFESKAIAMKRVRAVLVPVAESTKTPSQESFVHCPTEQHDIPYGGCLRRQEDGKRCDKGCKYLVGKRAAKEKVAKAPRITKVGIIREMFSEKDSWTIDELVARSGHDASNVRISLSILRNPEKTTVPVNTTYDRKTKTFTLVK